MKNYRAKISDKTYVELLGIDIFSLSEVTFMFSDNFTNNHVIGYLMNWIDMTFDTKSRVVGSGANAPFDYRILFQYKFDTKNAREKDLLKYARDKLKDIYKRAIGNGSNAEWCPKRVQMDMLEMQGF